MAITKQFYDKKTVDSIKTLLQGILDAYGVRLTTVETNYIAKSTMGLANGVATLDTTGKVPSTQLPSFVDDILEYETFSSFPNPGESGKLYVSKDTNLTYRWSGTQYTEVSKSLALGETSSTAYAGDKGKQNADNISSLQTLVNTINSNLNGKAPTNHASNSTTYGAGDSANYGHVKLFKLAQYSDSNKTNDDSAITSAFANALCEALHDKITSEITQTLLNYATTSALSTLQNKVTELENSMLQMSDLGNGVVQFTQN